MAAYDFQSALDNLAGGGALQTLWAIAFCTLESFRICLNRGIPKSAAF